MKTKNVPKTEKLQNIKYLIAIIIFIYIIVLSSTLILNYHVKPIEVYKVSTDNLIEDGSFEKFNQTAGDCCNANPNASKVFASKSLDAISGKYSLNLTSYSQCACISKPLINFTNSEKYLLSFYYKGDNPRTCLYTTGDKKCLFNENVNISKEWNKYYKIIKFTENSDNPSVYLYTDANGKLRTNFYDNLQINRLVYLTSNPQYRDSETYIIKTKTDNLVNGIKISDNTNGEAYYLVKGKPIITVQFPYTELVLIIIMMLIMVRLILKKKDPWE